MRTVRLAEDKSVYLTDTTWDEFEAGHKLFYSAYSHRSLSLVQLERHFEFIQKQPNSQNILWLAEVGGIANERKYPRREIFKLFGYTMKGYYVDGLMCNRDVRFMSSQTGPNVYNVFKRIHYYGIDYYSMRFAEVAEFNRHLKINSLLRS